MGGGGGHWAGLQRVKGREEGGEHGKASCDLQTFCLPKLLRLWWFRLAVVVVVAALRVVVVVGRPQAAACVRVHVCDLSESAPCRLRKRGREERGEGREKDWPGLKGALYNSRRRRRSLT